MYIHKDDLKKIVSVFEKFPNAEFFTLHQDHSSGIGAVTTMTIPLEVAGQEGEFTIEISGTENW
jgi:hypothetical protein